MVDYEQMVWSFSRIHSHEQCPYEFYLNYLLKDEDGNRIYDRDDNFYGVFGSFCHELLEQILTKEITIDDAYIKYQEEFDDHLSVFDIKDSTKEKYFYLGLSYFSNLTFDWLDQYEILGVEKEVRFQVDKYKFVGFIDLLIREKSTGKIIVIDHKSSEYPLGKRGGVKKAKQKSYDSYKRQLYLYSKAVYEEYGQFPDVLAWNYFREEKWLDLPFIKNEYEESLKWAVDTIHKIKSDTEFPANIEHFYCKNLCGFRNNICEYIAGGY